MYCPHREKSRSPHTRGVSPSSFCARLIELQGRGESVRKVFEVGENSASTRLRFKRKVAMYDEVADEINDVVVPEIKLSTHTPGSSQQMERVILLERTVDAPHDFAPRDRNTFGFSQRSTPWCLYARGTGESITPPVDFR
jgi:hypothetical protein